MKKFGQILIAFTCTAALVLSAASAHSGRTDGSGGHKDNKNKSGLGSYHYHCGGYPPHLHDGGYCPYTDVLPSSVKLTVEKKTLGIGETVLINASVSPSNACDTSVSLKSSDSGVVRIVGDTAEAVGYGTATITASSFNGKSTSVKMTVKEITAEAVTISAPEAIEPIYIGQGFTLNASIQPTNTDNKTITWSSDNENIASVSNTGLVTPLAVGDVTVTATASNGVSANYMFHVHEKAVESIRITDRSLSLFAGESCELSAEIIPKDATDPTVTWSSDTPDVASVSDNGVLRAIRGGTAVITVTSTNGISDSIPVEISDVIAVESIDILSSLGETLEIGEVTELTAVVSPATATYPTITWSIDNPAIASIDANDQLEALAAGQITVTARSEDGFEETLEIEITSESSMAPLGGLAIVGAGGLAILKRKRR